MYPSLARCVPVRCPQHPLRLTLQSKQCYSSLVENLDFGDVACIKYSLSKGLGVGIVIGGSIMKVPQLLLSKLRVSYPR